MNDKPYNGYAVISKTLNKMIEYIDDNSLAATDEDGNKNNYLRIKNTLQEALKSSDALSDRASDKFAKIIDSKMIKNLSKIVDILEIMRGAGGDDAKHADNIFKIYRNEEMQAISDEYATKSNDSTNYR